MLSVVMLAIVHKTPPVPSKDATGCSLVKAGSSSVHVYTLCCADDLRFHLLIVVFLRPSHTSTSSSGSAA